MKSDPFNDLLDHIIQELVENKPQHAAEALAVLCDETSRAGLPVQTFMDLRKYCVISARERTMCNPFILERLVEAERTFKRDRTGTDQRIILC